jgi:hypothetical protein
MLSLRQAFKALGHAPPLSARMYSHSHTNYQASWKKFLSTLSKQESQVSGISTFARQRVRASCFQNTSTELA